MTLKDKAEPELFRVFHVGGRGLSILAKCCFPRSVSKELWTGSEAGGTGVLISHSVA